MTRDQYQRFLMEAGFTADDAAQIARLRLQARNRQTGTIRMESTAARELEVLIYDFIGFDFWSGGGLTPQWLVDQLKEAGPLDRITVRVNSPGGDVFDAITLYNILRRQTCTVAVEIEGLAASAASYLVQAASPGELQIADSAMMMIHRAWVIAMGNAAEMRETADVLEKLDGQIANIYAARSGVEATHWLDLMGAETWLTGAEAVAAKLADRTTEPLAAAAAIDLTALGGYRNTPAAWVERVQAERKQREQEEYRHRQQEAEAVAVRVRLLDLEAL